MECNNNHEMTQEEVLTNRTTTPLEDDQYETMWWCETCQEAYPLEKDQDDTN